MNSVIPAINWIRAIQYITFTKHDYLMCSRITENLNLYLATLGSA